MTLWLLHRAPDRPTLFELRPYTFDVFQADWFPQAARILASDWNSGEALVPRGLVKLSIGEDGAWFGARVAAGATPAREMSSLRVRRLDAQGAA